jgi:hypothetical protein
LWARAERDECDGKFDCVDSIIEQDGLEDNMNREKLGTWWAKMDEETLMEWVTTIQGVPRHMEDEVTGGARETGL